MPYIEIDDARLAAGQPVTQGLMRQINSNLKALHEENLQFVVANTLIEGDPIGPTSRLMLFYFERAVDIVKVQISPLADGEGSGGVLTLDVKKGNTPISEVSIFEPGQNPCLFPSDTLPVSGILSENERRLDPGTFLEVSIPSAQTEMTAFHLYIEAKVASST